MEEIKLPIEFNDYDTYVRVEWDKFVNDSSRAHASLEATANAEVNRVLDVGCGAGQEMLPFVTEKRALGFGMDIAETVGQVGRKLYAAYAPSARVNFLRGTAEDLPFPSGSFDVVICRLALPYTDNERAFAEVARVLRPNGKYFLKISGVRWYLFELRQALKSWNIRSLIHASRVLVSGSVYHITRQQPRSRIPSPETFQSEWLLRRELARHGLFIRNKTPDSNPITPSFVIVKEGFNQLPTMHLPDSRGSASSGIASD
jgi:ubiquinone/menaquinone biosynthesis C-methylase UbiE